MPIADLHVVFVPKIKIVLDTKTEAIENPCRVSSLPYWKTKSISVPDDMLIVHDEQYQTGHFDDYSDECYFRLRHDMNELQKPEILLKAQCAWPN